MRPLIVILALALAALQFRLWILDGGIREVWRLEAQVAERTEENRGLAERNDALAAEVQDLKNGLAAAEERARAELGMVLPSESFYQIMPLDALARVREAMREGGAPLPPGAALEQPGDPPPPLPPPQQHIDSAGAAVPATR